MRSFSHLLLLLLATVLHIPATGKAEDFDPFAEAELSSSSSRMEFLSEAASIAPGKPFHIAIKLTHPQHWHSYFINPGYVGRSLRPNWKLPPDFKVERVAWPVPHIGTTAGKRTYGYEPLVYHLFRITPPAELETGQKVTIEASPNWMICNASNCFPEPGLGQPPLESRITLPVSAEGSPQPGQYLSLRGGTGHASHFSAFGPDHQGHQIR